MCTFKQDVRQCIDTGDVPRLRTLLTLVGRCPTGSESLFIAAAMMADVEIVLLLAEHKMNIYTSNSEGLILLADRLSAQGRTNVAEIIDKIKLIHEHSLVD